MSASFGYDISTLNDSNNVLVLSAETSQLGKDILLTEQEKKSVRKIKNK